MLSFREEVNQLLISAINSDLNLALFYFDLVVLGSEYEVAIVLRIFWRLNEPIELSHFDWRVIDMLALVRLVDLETFIEQLEKLRVLSILNIRDVFHEIGDVLVG